VSDRFFCCFCARPHDNDDALRIGSAGVVKQFVGAASLHSKAIHHVLHNGRAGKVEGIARLARLEEDVRVLGGAAQDRPVGAEGALAMRNDVFVVEQGTNIGVADRNNLVDFVGGAEAVKEMQERNARFEGCDVGDQG
jgi:hypothetical protein